jgi:hypothetical protein
MASTESLVSVEEYLKTSYSPDCDYVDGVVEERNFGERDHAWIQGKFAALILGRSERRA